MAPDRADPVALHEFEHPPTPTLVQALAAVIADLPGMSKGDKSPEGYAYRGIESITKELQPLLAKHRVVFVPSARVTQIVPSPAMKDGWQDVYVEVDWTIVGPDGSILTARTNGIGRDRSDKGANKAQTQAFKYLLLHLLCIADKADDADGQTYEHDRQERPQPPPLPPEVVELREALAGASEDVQKEFVKLFGKTRDLALEKVGEASRWLIGQENDALMAEALEPNR